MSIEEFDEIDPEDIEAACELFDKITANAAQLPRDERVVSWRQIVSSDLKSWDAPICLQCNGSGEGMYDGSCCSACGGSGHEKLPEELDHDIDVDDYWN